LSVEGTILQQLAQHLQDMAAELRELIQEAHAVVGQRHVARHRHVASADQPRIRDGVEGRATRAGGDDSGAGARAAGDAVDTRGLKGLGAGHRRPYGGESAGQHRFTQLWSAE
jgi:hypothetical protein